MGWKISKVENAERLLALHDELDTLDKKESYTALSFIFLGLAAVLIAMGMDRASTWMMMNGFFSGIAGVVMGARELSKLRRIRALRRQINGIEEGGTDAGEEPPVLEIPG